MTTKRRTPTCRYPLFLSAVITLGIASLFAVLVTSLAQAHGSQPYTAQVPQGEGGVAAGEQAPMYSPGVVLVKLKAGAAASPAPSGMAVAQAMEVGAAGAANLFQSYGVISAEPLFPSAAAPAGYSTQAVGGAESALSRVYKLHLAAQLDAKQIAVALAADPNVEYAEPDYIARGVRIPNDPEYWAQWALTKVGAPAAWDLQTGSPNVVIAVIDSGVDTDHPEFAGRLWENDDPVDGVDNDLNGQVDDLHGWNVLANNNDLADPSGHGTQVGGVIGAAADNGVGVAGLCWNCKLMFVKAMQASGAANYSDVAKAVQYAASNGAQVINLSLGGYADSAVLHDAIREAATTAVIVAGAGNDDSSSPFYPAAYPAVLAVAATDQNDQKAIFSNYGAWVDISAPGEGIRTTTVGGYTTDSGTSLAAPFVTGLAGLIRSQYPTWTLEQVTWHILNSATNIDAANPTRTGQLGSGRVAVGAALATVPQAKAVLQGYAVDGEANGRPAPGQTFRLVLTIQNQWLPGQNLQATLTSNDPNISITDSDGAFGNLGSGQTGTNAANPFGVAVNAGAPYNAQLSLLLNLSGDGGFSLKLPFTIQVRSSLETVSGFISSDTVWTNDKTYLVVGNVLVETGITLTIEPGTTVRFRPEKAMQIEGTLIADGQAASPILFTSEISKTQGSWGPIRFATTAVSADVSAAGEYLGGSIIRHARMEYGSGIAVLSMLPYLADNEFDSNSATYAGNWVGCCSPAVVHYNDQGGPASTISGTFAVRGSTFTNNSGAAVAIANIYYKAFEVTDNTIFNQGGAGVVQGNIGAYSSLIARNVLSRTNGISILGTSFGTTIEDNIITESTGPAYIGGYGVDIYSGSPVIRHNLFANNGHGEVMCNGRCSIINVQGGAPEVTHNTLIGNHLGTLIHFHYGGAGTYQYNNFVGNQADYVFYRSTNSNSNVAADSNYWGTTNTAEIDNLIFDYLDDFNPGRVYYTPVLPTPDSVAPAFVSSTGLDPDPVGIQPGTITVDFSRPMVTDTVPAVSFHDSRRDTSEAFTVTTGSAYEMKLTEDSLGRVWFGGSTNLLMYSKGRLLRYTVPLDTQPTEITALHGTAGGDLWVGLNGNSTALAVLRGTTWTTFTQEALAGPSAAGVTSIAEDNQGAVWIGTPVGASRFDGGVWTRYYEQDGLGGNYVRQIVSDRHGRIWMLGTTESTGEAKLSVFDGAGWTVYGAADGLSNMSLGTLFADSGGRVWIGTYSAADTQGLHRVAMFDGAWHFFGAVESGGKLFNPVSAFVETSDGAVWMLSAWQTGAVRYKDRVWDVVAGIPNLQGGAALVDRYDNLWYEQAPSQSAYVIWHGLNYRFENGRWLSATRFQADYTFTPDVPPSLYAVDISGAVDASGMPAANSRSTFRVDFGVGVTLDPPAPPLVTSQTTGSLSNLAASWTPPGSNIDQYRYAIGTAPGARDVVGWTYLVSTGFVRSDLNLIQGQTYYVTVQAHNTSGMWSTSGTSNGVTAGQTPTPTPTPTLSPTPSPTPSSTPSSTPSLTPSLTPSPTPSPTPSLTPTVAPFIPPGTGGTQPGQVGSLDLYLTVPPNAITEPIRLSMQPALTPPATGGLAILGQSFAINAQTAGGTPVTQFAAPLVLVIHYTDAEAAGLDESRLQIFYWGEVQQQWIAVPTTVDAQANTLTVYLDHLTLFAVLETEARVPKLYLPQIRR